MEDRHITPRPQPSNRTALVTGGTFGIGRATALELARQSLTVVITGRDAARAQATVSAIQQASGNGNVAYLLGDFFRLAQVQTLAQAFLGQYDRLDILVNNAGGTFQKRRLTPDGFERTWALNHLAYMELTLALLPLLKASAPARIINVASGWYAGKLDFDNLQGERRFSTGGACLRSKLANHLFTYAVARRLVGTGVTVNAVNPGMVDTGIGRDAKGLNRVVSSLLTPLKKTPEQGAFPSVYMATSPEVEGVNGKFFDKDKFVPTKPVTHDEVLQERLWRVSLEQLGQSESGGVAPSTAPATVSRASL